MYAIETHNLSKSFHGINAINDLNMHVPEGSIYGFIGENGSGKSTTEKLICGLLVKSGGNIKLFGKDYTDADIRSQLGVLIENPACFPSSTVYQNLYMQALNLGIRNPKAEIKRVLELVSMGGAAGRKFKQCSLGMKQRIGLAQSLMGHPKMLILDEPINGLDADGKTTAIMFTKIFDYRSCLICFSVFAILTFIIRIHSKRMHFVFSCRHFIDSHMPLSS